jgi:dihydroxyacid dehydratase/phosphogluconate dehydratase
VTHYSLLATFGVRLTTYHCSLLTRLECAAAPGSGGCAAMFTASSMAFAIEVSSQ